MAFESNYVTMIGNLTDDPELRFTPSGAAVCSFRIASNRRYRDRNDQQQEETTFMAVNCWRTLAENVAESLRKGDRAVVIGRVKVRSYEAQDGTTRWVTEIEADEISPSLRWAKASVTKTSGSGADSGSSGSSWNATPPVPSDDDVPF
jgi:single-strand DNA-binding protein